MTWRTGTTTALEPLILQNLSLSGWSLFGAIGAATSPQGPKGPNAGTPSPATDCGGISGGLTVDLSTINPFTSGGGGMYGFNLQYVPGQGWGLYTFSTPAEVASLGLDLGASITGNLAVGSGDWVGDFGNVAGTTGPFTWGGFFTPPGQPGSKASGVGWYGLQAGRTFGATYGAGAAQTNYKRLFGPPRPCR